MDPLQGLDLIEVVGGDNSRPKIRFQLVDGVSGVPVDCSNPDWTCSVRFRASGSTTTLQERSCTREAGGYDGVWYFQFSTLDYDAGRYEAQVTLTLGTSQVQSAWNLIKFRVRERFAAVPT